MDTKMNNDKADPSQKPDPKPGKPEEKGREERLSDALRANLRRRKAAAKKDGPR
ncbi:hypothetical protein GCM10011316_21770 [Roseibium aquae]|uniref:Uncharacterized protein n=1 Tax=Roseibium aquae TaxID=1323746 RepID=A0A916TJS3_9HYPH|nr:hypothetical protein GCM10011316_21770 [Roseibium aquae]